MADEVEVEFEPISAEYVLNNTRAKLITIGRQAALTKRHISVFAAGQRFSALR